MPAANASLRYDEGFNLAKYLRRTVRFHQNSVSFVIFEDYMSLGVQEVDNISPVIRKLKCYCKVIFINSFYYEVSQFSNRLEKKDKIPAGMRETPSLREMEEELICSLHGGLAAFGGDLTVFELVEKYVALKIAVRESTKTGYKTVLNILQKEYFGTLRIDKVKISDAKAWLVKLQQVDHRGYSSIHSIRGVLRPAFQMAVEDELIKKNPFSFELHTVVVNDSKKKRCNQQKRGKTLS